MLSSCRWPGVTLNHLKPSQFLHLALPYLSSYNWWSQRLQIWCTGWMCKSQPTDDKPSLIRRGQVMRPIKNFWGSNHITGTAEPKVFKFCTQVGYINSSNMLTSPTTRAWSWSRDCFKILPFANFAVLQSVARVRRRQLSYLLHFAWPFISSLQVIVNTSNLGGGCWRHAIVLWVSVTYGVNFKSKNW